MTKPKVPDMKSPYSQKAIGNATFTVGAEATNVITVSAQLKDGDGNNLTVRACVDWYLATAATGAAFATAVTGGVAAGTNGAVKQVVTGIAGIATCNASGQIDFAITDTGTPTVYLIIRMPDGTLKASGAITFT